MKFGEQLEAERRAHEERLRDLEEARYRLGVLQREREERDYGARDWPGRSAVGS